jgi:very-short-patch-repair endonuclease
LGKAIERARSFRKNPTDAETAVWQKIRAHQLGWKFRRQVSVGIYIVDFLCLDLKVIVEIDGGQHVDNKKDEVRTSFLNNLGYKVIRFWNNEVLENMEGVLSTLTLTLSQREREKI